MIDAEREDLGTAQLVRGSVSQSNAAVVGTEAAEERRALAFSIAAPGGLSASEEGADAQRLVPEGEPATLRRDAVFRRLLALADVAAAVCALEITGLFTGHPLGPVSLATVPLIVLIAKMMGRYDHDELVLRKSTLDELPPLVVLAATYALVWSFSSLVLGDRFHLKAGGVSVLWFSTAALLVTGRATARAVAKFSAPRERVLIVGASGARQQLAHSLASDPGARLEVVGFLPLEDERRTASDWGPHSRRKRQLTFDDLGDVARELDVHRVFLIPTTADSDLMLDAVSRTTALGVKVTIVPRLFEVVGSAVEFDSVGGVTVLGVPRGGLSRSSLAVKRAMDIVGAGIGVFALLPLGLLIALAIKLDSPGPVFFRQRRVGREGRVFEMIKFRSMIDGAHAQREALAARNETNGVFKLSTDPRVTRVGRLLRRSSIDELPQLINVLRGDMSLVGPRPLVLDEDKLVDGRHRERRLQFAPGITGPWQVLGPRRPPLSEMVKTDYLYAANWSLWTDVKIMLRTFGHMFAQRGM